MKGVKAAASLGAVVCQLAVSSIFLISPPLFAQAKFIDPLDSPATMRTKITQRPLMAVAKAGERVVAVGPRGLVIGSGDKGKTWAQAKVPVQSDLLAVHFPTTNEGWVVGHDGVILHSADGGNTWLKQLDGRMAEPSFRAFYSQLGPTAAAALASLDRNYKTGPALPFLDVWFEDGQRGFAVGSFGMIAATSDGGKTWEPWLHRIDNGEGLNLNAIRGIGGEVYIAGERGRIYRLDRVRGYFTAIDTGYNGSFFGIAGNGDALIAYGLRGTTYRSAAVSGARWERVQMPNEHTISAGTTHPDGTGFVLVNVAGQLLIGDRLGKHFQPQPTEKLTRMTGIAFLDGQLSLVTSIEGVSAESIVDSASRQPRPTVSIR